MRVQELLPEAGKASKKLCRSKKPDHALGASQLASCKSQGLRARDTKRKYKIRGKTASIDGKKIRGGKYGGSLPVHGKKNKQNAQKGSSDD